MTQEEIIELARQAGIRDSLEYDHMECDPKSLEAFAKLVAAKERDKWMDKAADMIVIAINSEREANAKTCESLEDDGGEWDIQQQCANAIRARGEA